MKFQIYRAADGWRWRLVSANHNILGDSGEAYYSKWNAKRAVKRLAKDAMVIDE